MHGIIENVQRVQGERHHVTIEKVYVTLETTRAMKNECNDTKKDPCLTFVHRHQSTANDPQKHTIVQQNPHHLVVVVVAVVVVVVVVVVVDDDGVALHHYHIVDNHNSRIA